MSEQTINLDENKKKSKKDKGRKKKNKKKKKKLLTYLKETKYELKQVSWSTKKETLKYTGTVLLVVFISSLIVCGMDSLLSFGLKTIIK